MALTQEYKKSRKDTTLYKVGRLRSLKLSHLYADSHPDAKIMIYSDTTNIFDKKVKKWMQKK